MSTPTAPPPDVLAPLPVRHVPALEPLRWLALGWRDFAAMPGPGLLHGLLVAAGGLAALAVAQARPLLVVAALSAFLMVGPILATGLYELSRLRSRGLRPGLADAIGAWRRGTAPLVALGLLLGALAALWVLLSIVLFALFINEPVDTLRAFLRYAVQVQGHLAFTLWLAGGGLLAAVVFAVTAVSPPLLLGRVIGLRRAIMTSVRAVGENPVAMGLWAAIIMAATALSVATLMLGFVVAIPVLGHATWHAYRDLVDTTPTALRY